MKALRIALSILAGVVLLLIIVVVIIVRSFDLNDYKDEIADYVYERTGRTLTIGDNIEFSLFPWFAVETGNVTLSEDLAFGDRDFVNIGSLSARVRVWPLLRRRIEIGRVILDGIDVNLGLDAEGRGNWSSLLARESTVADDAAPSDERSPAINALAVEGIELRNSRLFWRDASGEVIYRIGDLDLITGPINDNDPVDLSASLSVLDVASQTEAEVTLETVATLLPTPMLRDTEATIRVLDTRDEQRARVTVSLGSIELADTIVRSGPISISADLDRPPIGPQNLALAGRIGGIELDTETETLVIESTVIESGALRAGLDLRGESILSSPMLSGSATAQSEQFAALLRFLGIEPDPSVDTDSLGGFTSSAEFSVDAAAGTFTVPRLVLAALGIDVAGSAELTSGENLSANISIPEFVPSAALRSIASSRLPDGVELSAIGRSRLTASLTGNLTSGELAIDSFDLGIDDAGASGTLSVDDFRDPERVAGTLGIGGLDNRLLEALAGAWLPDPLTEAELGVFRLDTTFAYEPATRTASFAPIALAAYGLSGEGQLSIAAGGDRLRLFGRAALSEFSPHEVLNRFGLPAPETSDPDALRSAALAATFETVGADGEFRDIVVALDDSRITGELSVEDFADPSYRFVLRADRIDVDRYLPPTAADASPESERTLGEMRLANEPLTATTAIGSATVGRLKIGGMNFEQLSTSVAFGGGRAEIRDLHTGLYGGEFSGRLAIDTSAGMGMVTLAGDLRQVGIGPLLTAMLGDSQISGSADIAIDLRGQGDTINEALTSAAGSLELNLRDGELMGVNLGYELCAAVNKARGLRAPGTAAEVTPYSLIRGSAIVSDGIATSSDLAATTNFLSLTGNGGVRLVDQWIDTRQRARLTGPIPISGCEDVNESIADDPVALNFTLNGRLPDIDVGFDISELLEDIVEREIRQRVQEERDELRNELINRILQ